MTSATLIATDCIECGAHLELAGDTEVGEFITCQGCCAGLEVMGLNPVSLALAPEEDEDWGE